MFVGVLKKWTRWVSRLEVARCVARCGRAPLALPEGPSPVGVCAGGCGVGVLGVV